MKDESIENGEELIEYGTSITYPRVSLKEGEFRCNINDLTSVSYLTIHTKKFMKNCLNEYLLTHFTLRQEKVMTLMTMTLPLELLSYAKQIKKRKENQAA